MNLTAQSVWDGRREAIRNGSGTEEDPYLIENAQNLAWFVYLINWDYGCWAKDKHFLLTTDIDLNGSPDNQWIPICAGGSVQGGKWFNGVFDGGFHKITGLYIDTISDIHSNESTWNSNAALFHTIKDGIIKNLYLEGEISSPHECAGLLYWHGTVENCIVNVDVVSTGSGYYGAAGIIFQNGNVEKSANLGNITARNSKAGGVIGSAHGNRIINCYNIGSIEGDSYVGGIAGMMPSSSQIYNCYNVGDVVSSGEYKGGVVGRRGNSASIWNSYYREDCIDESNEYGEPKSAAFMRTQEFVDLLNSGNETDVWTMDTENTNDGYPIIGDTHFGVSENFFTNTDLVIVYPNPVTDYINIVGDVASYEIYDVVGKCVRRDARPCVSTVSASDFQSGIYIMKFVMRNGSVVTKKIVKK